MKLTPFILLFFLLSSCHNNNLYEYWEINPNETTPLCIDNRQNYTTFKTCNDTLAIIIAYKRFLTSLSDTYSEAFYSKSPSLSDIKNTWNFSVLKNKEKDITNISFPSRAETFKHLYDSILSPTLLKYEKFKKQEYEKSKKEALNSILITSYYLSSPNSAGGVDAYLYYKNLSNKTIKYLQWKGYAINAVDDMVKCEVRDSYSYSGRDTGPVKKGQKSGGCWSCAWYNYSAKKLLIDEIEITYMDGSSLRLTNELLAEILNK